MLRDLEIFVALIFLFIGVFFIFGARGVVRKRILKEGQDENKVVFIFKVISYVIIVLALAIIYYLVRR